jgi:hypothetical protein
VAAAGSIKENTMISAFIIRLPDILQAIGFLTVMIGSGYLLVKGMKLWSRYVTRK